MKKVLCFGEILLRMSPPAEGAWIRESKMPVYVGGAEANVATALAGMGIPVKYSTAMPDNYVAADIAGYLSARGIDTSAIHYSGNRIGLYYMQQGADLKNAGVIYDRAYSSFYELKPGMIDWDAALADVSWFHFTAISPALNENVTAVCREALEAAAARGITISVDLNYRSKLWKWGKKPVDVMPELAGYCDVIMGNIWAAHTLLGIGLDRGVEAADDKAAYLAHSARTAADIMQRFPACRTVAHTFRFDKGASGVRYYSALHTPDGDWESVEFNQDTIVDKAGSGDCFMGGLIYGLYHLHPPGEIINFAAAAAFGKLNETGDATSQTTADILQLLQTHE